MTNSPDALATALEALDAKATTGPWEAHTADNVILAGGQIIAQARSLFVSQQERDINTLLICELRNALPELLAALRALRGPQESKERIQTSDKLPDDIGLSIDMIAVDRLKLWAKRIAAYGPNISEWGDSVFVAEEMLKIAYGLEDAVRDIGLLRARGPQEQEKPYTEHQDLIERLRESTWDGGRRRVMGIIHEAAEALEAVDAKAVARGPQEKWTAANVRLAAEKCNRGAAGGPWIDWAQTAEMLHAYADSLEIHGEGR